MCGIAGTAGLPAPDPDAVLATMGHRGPDANSTVTFELNGPEVHFFHSRLAINDLSEHGNQPLRNEDGTVSVIFNGEIYNSPELRQLCSARGHHFTSESDGEVIAHLWEDVGVEAFRKLNGIFSIALFDATREELLLVRDPIGVKPMFYALSDNDLWFGSELTTLKALGAPLGSDDVVAHAQFLSFLWVPDPRTPHANVRSLRPGQLLRWRRDSIDLEEWCHLPLESEGCPSVSVEQALEEIGDRLAAAVNRQMLSDVPVALMASGGIDSSAIWWAAQDRIARAYTIDWAAQRTSERLDQDTSAVQLLEKTLGTPVTYIPTHSIDLQALPSSGDLFSDPAVELCRMIARAAHGDGTKVLLSGQGGDEVFGGYRRHLVGPLAAAIRTGGLGRTTARALRRLPTASLTTEYLSRAADSSAERDPLASYMTLCTYSTPADRARILGCMEAEVSNDVVWQSHREFFETLPDDWSLLRRFRALDLGVYLPGLGLAYSDRSGMSCSVEIRVPLLDVELVRWALRFEDRALVAGRTLKPVLRSVVESSLPPAIGSRPKRGFAVPSETLSASQSPPSRRSPSGKGFRQDRYVVLAESLLRRWRSQTS